MVKPVAFVDFETQAINGAIPPAPVGVSIQLPEQKPFYLAWHHDSDNNSSFDQARSILRDVYATHEVCYHNAQFDLGVGKHHMGLEHPNVVHDTLFLLYLRNPHAKTLSLKPSADNLLGWQADEQAKLHEWIIRNVPNATHKNAGAFISKAPGSMVASYAMGDTARTKELFNYLKEFRTEAYDRETKLVKILTNNTLRGVKLDLVRLETDYRYYSNVHKTVDIRIYNHLGGFKFNIDSAEELATAIERSGIAVNWVLTPTGKRSTSKPNLLKAIQDRELLDLLNYRSTLSTYLETFFTSWLEKSVNGRIHFSWNQVRNQEQENKKGFMGTRTGRLSSTPSMLNVPGSPPDVPDYLMLPSLPAMRSYLIADEGHSWLKRDYSQQELRVLAHYEDGALMEAYKANPNLDMHNYMAEVLSSTLGRPIARKTTKNMAFGLLYGMGLALLAEKMGCSYDEAKFIKGAYLNAVPGIKSVQSAIKEKWSAGLPFKTFGGRLYYKEESKIIVDPSTGLPRMQDFIYKGLNYLIQGSSADITKQAIINYEENKNHGDYQIAVHDEINIQGPLSEMKLLKEAMSDIELDVPLLSEGFIGQSYGELVEFEAS